MPNYILVGDEKSIDIYIENFQKKEGIKDIDITHFNEKLLIEQSRQLLKTLSLKYTSKKLFIFKSGITIEAQNALLKNFEEADVNNTFFICGENLNLVLPTIQSRCFIVNLKNEAIEINPTLCDLLTSYSKTHNGLWELIDKIESYEYEDTLKALLYHLEFLLNKDFQKEIYYFSKNLLFLYPLVVTNNINKRIALEKAFAL